MTLSYKSLKNYKQIMAEIEAQAKILQDLCSDVERWNFAVRCKNCKNELQFLSKFSKF